MNSYDEGKKIVNNYADKHVINGRPDAQTREFIRKLRKEKNMPLEDQIEKIIADYSKEHNLKEIENPLDRLYEKSITTVKQEIHGELYRGKNVSKNLFKDILRTILIILAMGAAIDGAIDLALLDKYKAKEERVEEELDEEDWKNYDKANIFDMPGLRVRADENKDNYTVVGSRKDGTHNIDNEINMVDNINDIGLMKVPDKYLDQMDREIEIKKEEAIKK